MIPARPMAGTGALQRLAAAMLALGCTASPITATAATGMQTLVHDGVERRYSVRAPDPAARQPLPLVLVLHGGGGNAGNAEQMSGFTAKARSAGFIVAYPEGSGRLKGRLLTWNAGHCCGYAMEHKTDDVGFISALIDRLSRDYPVDPRRIYATGMSNGGMMTHRLGIELSGKLAAIAPVVATLFGDEPLPAYPVSALMINGLLDQSVPAAGGAPGGRGADAWDGRPALPAIAQAAFWSKANGCSAPSAGQHSGALIRHVSACPAGRAVELLLVKDNGHAWPGGQAGRRRGDAPSRAVDATGLIWDFFAAHPKAQPQARSD